MMVQYLGLQDDGFLFSAPHEKVFIEKYEQKWAETMSNTYFQSEQIDVGHKLRPRLVFWGYLSNVEVLDSNNLDNVAQVAVCIELIHKSSLLIDDFIDKDITRHNKPAFYKEHGVERTIIYSLNLLSKSLELLNKTYYEHNNINSFYYRSINDITQTLQEMTLGVLKELDLNEKSIVDLSEIKTIMDLETSSLITNSLIMGYYLSGRDNNSLEKILKDVGKNLGYIFQILNDMEAFFSSNIHNHKGHINTDIDRARKNVCIPVLFEMLSSKEKKSLLRSDNSFDEQYTIKLLSKYKVKETLIDEIHNIHKKINCLVSSVNKTAYQKQWSSDFIQFIDSVINVFLQRVIDREQ